MPAALARLQHMNQDVIGGRKALTPVLKRDDPWERRQSGKGAPAQPFAPLEILQQQAEMAASQGYWGHYPSASQGSNRYSHQQPTSNLAHSYTNMQVDDDRRDQVMSSVRSAARTDASQNALYGGASTSIIPSPPQAYNSSSTTTGNRFAALDLGSNSFRLEIARLELGQLQRMEYYKETVRQGGGLDADRRLSQDAMQRGWNCLARFAERLAGFKPSQVRAVATQTLREARNREEFLTVAQQMDSGGRHGPSVSKPRPGPNSAGSQASRAGTGRAEANGARTSGARSSGATARARAEGTGPTTSVGRTASAGSPTTARRRCATGPTGRRPRTPPGCRGRTRAAAAGCR